MPLTCFAGFYGPYTPAVFSANAVFSPFCAAGGQIPVQSAPKHYGGLCGRFWPIPETPAATLATETGKVPSVHQGNAAGWAENAATLATIDGQGRRQRRSPAPALATRTAAATLATIDGQDSQRSPGQRRRVGLETRQPWPPETGKADASDVHPLRRWPPGRRRQPWPPKQARFRAFTRATAAGWAGNTATLGHHRRARPTPATFTRSGAGHRRRRRQPLATIDGQGRRQRHSPAPALATGDGGGNPGHHRRARFPAFTRATAAGWAGNQRRARPTPAIHPLRRWPPGRRRPPETAADASDIHPGAGHRRRRRQPWPPSTGKIPSVHQGNGGGLGWKHGNPGHRRRRRQRWPPSTGKADASDVHPLRRWPPGRRRQPWPPARPLGISGQRVARCP